MQMAKESPIPATAFAVEENAAPTAFALVDTLTEFLEFYGTASLVGREFVEIIGEGDGKDRLSRLLAAAGCPDDPEGLCRTLAEQLLQTGAGSRTQIAVNGVVFPHLLLVALLEQILPGDKFTAVKSVERLESLTHTRVPDEDRDRLSRVLETYPVRLSSHVLRQMRVSSNVAYQYMPFVEELDPSGHVNTWIGQFHQGLLEQMYQNRLIFLLNMSCPVYCRFCFRKHKDSRNQANPTVKDVKNAVAYVAQTPTVKEIVITGGDPFMNRKNLAAAVEGLMQIPHVQTLRLATRSIAYYPNLFYAGNSSLLKYVKAKNQELQMRGKRLEIATHFIHPDEVSLQSLDLITDFVNHGMAVYVQTPFLKDCNDQGPELVRLFSLLRGAGAELHYIYIPCSPIQGNRIYWTSIAKGIEAAHYLRAHLSDRVIPRICTATPIGKMDWHSSGWAVERDAENDRFIWIRTPYTPDYFKAFAPIANELDIVRVNGEGTIDCRYMADIGDDALLLGSRQPVAHRNLKTDAELLAAAAESMLKDGAPPASIVATGIAGVSRVHKTRVEIDLDRFDGDLTYLEQNRAVTDVVLAAADDAVGRLAKVERLVDRIGRIEHVNALRLRSLKFACAPERYTTAVLDRLGRLNRLTVVRPLRLEIEGQFVHSSQIGPVHRELAEKLRNKGITVYANAPLLGEINDSADEINRIAYRLREAGIEFHHVLVAGMAFQEKWNRLRPVDVAHVIDIGTRVRKDGSGREIPRYIIRTALGEVDFGLTSRLYRDRERLLVRLSPYDLDYYRQMEAGFEWPAEVALEEGSPVVPVAGLTDTGNFLVYAYPAANQAR
ncbi:MAG: radical SAM protein [Desulfobacterales bacterium]|nr:radical SAM protein [Desulfobacterales bacterium]